MKGLRRLPRSSSEAARGGVAALFSLFGLGLEKTAQVWVERKGQAPSYSWFWAVSWGQNSEEGLQHNLEHTQV